jgi:hypothetical protein
MDIVIGMDISLSSTAVTIIKDNEEFIFVYLKEGKTSKWANMLDGSKNIDIKRIKNNPVSKNYSENEIIKLTNYDSLSDIIINDISKFSEGNHLEIRIEGYSYTKNTNSIIDIIGLSTLIRYKLLNNFDCSIHIVSPSTLKLETCRNCYPTTEILRHHKKTGKPLKSTFIDQNHDGISGGKFTKFEIYKAIIESNMDTIIYPFLKDYYEDIFEMKKIPSPIDDINDSIMLSRINIKV